MADSVPTTVMRCNTTTFEHRAYAKTVVLQHNTTPPKISSHPPNHSRDERRDFYTHGGFVWRVRHEFFSPAGKFSRLANLLCVNGFGSLDWRELRCEIGDFALFDMLIDARFGGPDWAW
ncbi:hypothetical protein [Mycobacterium palustre]|uniref:hypothetical protein n=1 Tax=Mycobacterium palustre TaxID=153971 RepID=UPI00114DE894|nr:hypothetical protein [Mycobacterium palustre]MCV7101532.1 hypothetical protein [Mycobacterium palustre]